MEGNHPALSCKRHLSMQKSGGPTREYGAGTFDGSPRKTGPVGLLSCYEYLTGKRRVRIYPLAYPRWRLGLTRPFKTTDLKKQSFTEIWFERRQRGRLGGRGMTRRCRSPPVVVWAEPPSRTKAAREVSTMSPHPGQRQYYAAPLRVDTPASP